MNNGDSVVGAYDPLGSAWLRRVRVTESFEEQWQQYGAADIAACLQQVPRDEQRDLLHELIKIDLEYRWTKRASRCLEEYLGEFPELGSIAAWPADLIVAEIRARGFVAQSPSREELESRFPGRADQLLAAAQDGSTQSRRTRNDDTLSITPGDRAPTTVTSQPTRLGRYELRASIGRGGFATVYRAWDPQLRREVAIKLTHAELLLDAGAVERVQREAQSAARLRHPAIVPVYEVGEHEGHPFIVSALLAGASLSEHLRHNTPTPEQAAKWALCIAEALEYAHECGVIHRDVKPSNILLDAEGHPLLADFGLARDVEIATTLTQHGDVLGTPAYMSPEQAAGRGHQVDGRTDVYALGVVLYEMLCGQVPFQGSAASVLQRVIHEEPPPPRLYRLHIPDALETICLKAMAKERDRRYTTAGALAADLQAFLDRRPISAKRTGTWGRFVLWCRRKPALAATIGSATAIIFLIASFSFLRVVAERDRYLRERETAVANLYDSLVRESRAIRLARTTGYRAEVWKRLQQALSLNTPARDENALRQEAAACLGDFVGLEPAEWTGFGANDSWITAVAFQPNSYITALGCLNGQIQLKDRETGQTVTDLHEHHSGVFAVSFSRDGRQMASMDDQGTICVWQQNDAQKWIVLRRFVGERSAEPHLIVAVSCLLTPDGTQVLSCAKGESVVNAWNVDSGERVGEYRGPSGELFVRAALSPDGGTLVAAYRAADMDGIVLWDVATREVKHRLPITRQAIVDVVFSGDGQYVACGCTNGTFVFDVAEWRQRLFVRSDDQFFTIAFHPERPWLAVPVSRSNSIVIWDVVSNQEVAALAHQGQPHSVSFAPAGTTLASATGKTVRLWNLEGGGERQVLAAHTGVVNRLIYRHDGRVLASCGKDGAIKLWNPATRRLLSVFSISDTPAFNIPNICFSADGHQLGAVDWKGGAAIFDVSTPEKPVKHTTLLSGEFDELLWDIAAGPDDSWAVGGRAGVRVWRDQLRTITAYDQGTLFVGFSDDGRRVAWTRIGDGQVGAWDVETSQALSLTALPSFNADVSFFPDSERLLGHVREVPQQAAGYFLVDLRSGKQLPLREFNGYSALSDAQLAREGLSRDGLHLSWFASQAVLMNLRTDRPELLLPAESSPIQSAAWSPDHSQIAIGLTDGTIVLWDLPAIRRELRNIGLDW